MSARPNAYASVRRPCDGGESPNRYVPEITAEVRVFAPPRVSQEEVLDALAEAFLDARARVMATWTATPRATDTWEPGDPLP